MLPFRKEGRMDGWKGGREAGSDGGVRNEETKEGKKARKEHKQEGFSNGSFDIVVL